VGEEHVGRDLLVRLDLGDEEQDLLLLGPQMGKIIRLIGGNSRRASR